MYKSSLDLGDMKSKAKATYDCEIAKAGVTREQALNAVKEQHDKSAYTMHKSSLMMQLKFYSRL